MMAGLQKAPRSRGCGDAGGGGVVGLEGAEGDPYPADGWYDEVVVATGEFECSAEDLMM